MLSQAALFGCSRRDSPPAGSSATTAAPATTSSIEPVATAPVSRLKAAGELAKPLAPWKPAYDSVVATLGPPKKVDPPTKEHGELHLWYSTEGEYCQVLKLEKNAGKTAL